MKNNLIIRTILSLFVCISLVGCSFGFDASAYVKSYLDALTKGEISEYAKITNTPEEDIINAYNEGIEAEINAINIYNLSEAQKNNFRTLFKDIYSKFQYDVGEAIKNSDGSYTVPVTTNKLIVFGTIMTDAQTYIMSYAKSNPSASETDLYSAICDFICTELTKNIANPQYGEEQIINVQVTKTQDNKYILSETEIEKLIYSMLDSENMQ